MRFNHVIHMTKLQVAMAVYKARTQDPLHGFYIFPRILNAHNIRNRSVIVKNQYLLMKQVVPVEQLCRFYLYIHAPKVAIDANKIGMEIANLKA